MSRHFDDLDAAVEFDALDDIWQEIFVLQASPCFRGGVDHQATGNVFFCCGIGLPVLRQIVNKKKIYVSYAHEPAARSKTS